jgi:hypothetical protein
MSRRRRLTPKSTSPIIFYRVSSRHLVLRRFALHCTGNRNRAINENEKIARAATDLAPRFHARDFHLTFRSNNQAPELLPRPDLYGARFTSDRAAVSIYIATTRETFPWLPVGRAVRLDVEKFPSALTRKRGINRFVKSGAIDTTGAGTSNISMGRDFHKAGTCRT